MATPRPQTAPADPAAASRAAAGSSIVVGVRVRPLTVTEQASGARSLIRVVDEQVLCFDPACNDDMHIASKLRGVRMIGHRAAKDQKYAFDCVFDTDATQEQVYQKTARPQIESVLSGYNATVFAYGATGARGGARRAGGERFVATPVGDGASRVCPCAHARRARPAVRAARTTRAQALARRTR